MKNFVKHLAHRAVQAAVISAICAILVNLIYINSPNPARLDLNFDWNWIVNAIIISVLATCMYVCYMNVKSFKYDETGYGGPLYETIIAIIVGLGLIIANEFKSIPDGVLIAIAIGAIATTAILALFWVETVRSLIFALFVSAIVGIFYHFYWGYFFDYA